MKENVRSRVLVSGCEGEENGYNTQLLYFTCSSLSRDDRYLFLITDKGGSPNVCVKDLITGEETILTHNENGIMKSYVYFDCRPGVGLSKASVCLDTDRAIVYYIRDNRICRAGLDGEEKILAEVTRTELMNNFGLISAYTTKTTNNNNRNTNIQLSAQAINGKTVLPGEIFSFNGATGERTAAAGYKEAPAISGGQSKDEVGGGVCQTSSTLFNAVARADLEIIERNPHAWPSSYIEKGLDATVNWPGLDFKFRNNTEWPVFIVAGYSKRQVTVNIYGMSLGAGVRIDLESELVRTSPQPDGVNYVVNPSLAPGESKKTITGRQGYEVTTWKVRYQGNRETNREVLFKTTYKAYQETVEYNPN